MERVFIINGQKNSTVNFTSEVDDDGDFVLFANGSRILFIAANDGTINRIWNDPDQQNKTGLKYNSHGIIVDGLE